MVECLLAKQNVVGSSPISRSKTMINIGKIETDLSPVLDWFERKMQTDPDGRVNNYTGTRKPNGAQHTISKQDRVFTFLFSKINQIARERYKQYSIIDIWTNVNLPNGINKKHTHVGADIAGCFYIKVPPNSGDIEFETGERFTPQAGDIYWWDASIPHWVHPNNSNEVRYSIAFNIKGID